jgi:hypothetical protein
VNDKNQKFSLFLKINKKYPKSKKRTHGSAEFLISLEQQERR